MQARIKDIVPTRKSILPQEIEAAIHKIASDIAEAHSSSDNLVLAAIANGGIALTEILRRRLDAGEPVASVLRRADEDAST